MQKLFLLLVSLFSLGLVQGQASRGWAPSAPAFEYIRVANPEEARLRHETTLKEALLAYQQAGPAERAPLEASILGELYQLFDLGIAAKESEVQKISLEIERMRTLPQYDANRQNLQLLEEALKTVQNTLVYRKLNRDRIVMQRFIELR